MIVHPYGLFVALGILVSYWLASRRAIHYRVDKSVLENLFPWVFVGGLIGARLYHVADYWEWYLVRPLSIFSVWEGGLGIFGALGGGLLTLWWRLAREHIPVLPVLDLLAPSLAVGQAIGRIGNFFNQEGFGPPTTLLWGVAINPEKRPAQFMNVTTFHPTHLYEALWLALGTVGMLQLERKVNLPKGILFGAYLFWMGSGRFFFEWLRLDTATVGPIKVAHVLSAVAVGTGLYFIARKARVA